MRPRSRASVTAGDDQPIGRLDRSKRTAAADIVAAAFTALAPEEREQAFVKINDVRLRELARTDVEIAHYVRWLHRVADAAGGELSGLYRRTRRQLAEHGEDVAEFNSVVRFFGSWRQAKDALRLVRDGRPSAIDRRSRGVGKVHRYSQETLRKTLDHCARDLGHVPLVVDFERWRRRQLKLAKTRGEELLLPSDSPYRREWGTWQRALVHFGFTPEAVAERLEPGRATGTANLTPFLYRPDAPLRKRGSGI